MKKLQAALEIFVRDIYAEIGFPLDFCGRHLDLSRILIEYSADHGGLWMELDLAAEACLAL